MAYAFQIYGNTPSFNIINGMPKCTQEVRQGGCKSESPSTLECCSVKGHRNGATHNSKRPVISFHLASCYCATVMHSVETPAKGSDFKLVSPVWKW